MSDLVGNTNHWFSHAQAHFKVSVQEGVFYIMTFEPRREKTGLRGFRPGPTQTGLYNLRSRLDA